MNNRHTGRLRKRRYLLQFVSTGITLVLFPCIMSLIIVAKQSYGKLTDTYERYYEETAEKFARFFSSQLNRICLSSNKITVDSRDSDSPACCLVSADAGPQSFFLYPAAQTIAEYAKSERDLFGIYYYDIDRLVTRQSSFSQQSFAHDLLGIELDTDDGGRLREFLSPYGADLTFFSHGPENDLFVGKRITVGRSWRKALLIFRLGDTSLDTSLLLANDFSLAQLSVLDEQGKPLISFGTEYGSPQELLSQLQQRRSGARYATTLKLDSGDCVVCAYDDTTTGFTYLLALPFDQIPDGARQFYSMLIVVLTSFILLLTGAVALLIYINYRPISALTRKLNRNEKNADEFGLIEDEINRMTDEISDQNIIIVDSLLANILYGVPISDEKLKRLAGLAASSCFFVFTLSSVQVNTTRRTAITAELLQRHAVKVFITDILFQNLTVLICMSETDCSAQVAAYLQTCFPPTDAGASPLRQGVTVHSPDDIRCSFESCFPDVLRGDPHPADSASADGGDDPTTALVRQIVSYIGLHFTDPTLSQSAVADHFAISTYSLSRLFKSKSGVGFAEYVSCRRIELAKRLLAETDATVAAIAVQVGIPNVNYFYKVFRDSAGMSPLKYRGEAAKKRPAKTPG